MLTHLRIENLALIERAEFDFDRGFICFTGETGAGKSVLLSALKLLSGERADKSCLRMGSETCMVEGLFYFSQSDFIDKILTQYDIPLCEDGNLLLTRLLGAKGQKITVNGQIVTLNVLREIGNQWIEFHDPTAQQKLFDPILQLQLFDAFSSLNDESVNYRAAFYEWRKTEDQIAELHTDQTTLTEAHIADLKNQLQQLASLDLTTEGIETLETDFQRLSKQTECLTCLNEIENLLNDDTSGVYSRLGFLQQSLRKWIDVWPSAQSLYERVNTLVVELQDIENSCLTEKSKFEIEPEQQTVVQQKMATWLDIQRLYGPDLAIVRLQKEVIQGKLERANTLSTELTQLQLKAQKLHEKASTLGQTLAKKRENAIPRFEQTIVQTLQKLGFQSPRFRIAFNSLDSLTPHGNQSATFLFASDKALPLLPIEKVASSGELARILLALKTCLALHDNTPVLVFDEIDANVGGETGTLVGRELKTLGLHHQVFCVTHLPQVAAQANLHFAVQKITSQGMPTIKFNPLKDESARHRELARMLGNAQSDSALQHAEVLLQQA